MNKEFICVASFLGKPNTLNELHDCLHSLIQLTRSESGCISYNLYQDKKNSRLLTMIEKFKDEESFLFHSQQPYIVNLRNTIGPLVESVSINTYETAENL